jgi:hypothetical protein
MAGKLPSLIKLPLNPPSGATERVDLTEYTQVPSAQTGQLEENGVYVATRSSGSCGEVQIKFECVKPYSFKAEEVGDEVKIISIYTEKAGDNVYSKTLPIGESTYFHWPFFMDNNGEPRFISRGRPATWTLYKL